MTRVSQAIDFKLRRVQMIEAFRREFDGGPTLGARAPGRVDLMGSHTDYNEGRVITLPIDRDTWIFARARDDGQFRVYSLNLESRVEFDGVRDTASGWGRYVQAVMEKLDESGIEVCGFDAVLHGIVPIGSGLSSSASVEAAVATLAELIGGFKFGKLEKARLCQRAENDGVGVNCGILDQYSSILGEAGKAIVLDCRSLTHETVPIADAIQPVICDTCAPRQLTGSEYGDRRRQCEQGAAFFAALSPDVKTLRDVSVKLFELHQNKIDKTVGKRCRFIIEENARVATLANALSANDTTRIQAIMAESYVGARDLFEISVPEMQAMYEAMSVAPGVIGCRQAGAGFGGCMIALVDRAALDSFVATVADKYYLSTNISPQVYPVGTAAGAGELDFA